MLKTFEQVLNTKFELFIHLSNFELVSRVR